MQVERRGKAFELSAQGTITCQYQTRGLALLPQQRHGSDQDVQPLPLVVRGNRKNERAVGLLALRRSWRF